MSIGVPCHQLQGWGMKLSTYLHLVPRLRISGAISLLPLYALMESTGTALPFIELIP